MSRKRPPAEVELNIASMLDMAFQLLTFFILTFRPPPLEPQIGLRLPPAQVVADPNGKNEAGDQDKNPVDIKGVNTLPITVNAIRGGENAGEIENMYVGQTECKDLDELGEELKKTFANPNNPFEQVIVQASPGLRYGELMKVVGICSRQVFPGLGPDGKPKRLEKLSFLELGDENK